MEGATLHIVSHTHWDREWYLPFQTHRMRLVELMDTLIRTLEEDPEFRSFHLDGQTIILEDYLEIRPENRERIRRLVQENRLFIGPWYVLQDEYLTSGEANIRNMMLGLRQARDLGPPVMVGYFPDSFGNISQMPQILRGFGIDAAVFGRGINPVGYGNSAEQTRTGYYSELTWQSPDGSSVFGIFLASWYNNANEIPAEPELAVAFLENARDRAARLATTSHLLLMNGSDHQPVQTDLPDVLRGARERMAEEIVHTSIPEYVETARRAADDLAVHDGELNSKYTKGWSTLTDTASSRMYLKQMNYRAERLLEREAEPLCTLAWLTGRPYPNALLRQSWTYLLQNHPHDSICGCSIDAVHDEMVSRFRSSTQVAEGLVERSVGFLLAQINTQRFGSDGLPVVVWNPLNWKRTEMIELDVDLPEYESMNGAVAADGESEAPVLLADQGVVFDYALPPDRFRQTKRVHRCRARFRASDVPGLGHKTFYLLARGLSSTATGQDDRVLENAHLRAGINDDGTVDLLHKESGRTYVGLLAFEDVGDCSDEYTFRAPEEGRTITSRGAPATIERVPSPPGETAYRIQHELDLPAGLADGQPRRRSAETASFSLATELRLASGGRVLDVTTTVVNRSKNHRVRALFPTPVRSDNHVAHGQFDVVRRENRPWKGWENPSYCRKQQSFVALDDDLGGLAIANRGLPEYEVLEEGSIALTLLRCVGELGDWGDFPTPGAQCLGEHTFRYALLPYAGSWSAGRVYRDALAFAAPFRAFQTSVGNGPVDDSRQWIRLDGDHLVVSAVKKAEHEEALVLRLYNSSDAEQTLAVATAFDLRAVSRANLEEGQQERLEVVDARRFTDAVGRKKIATYLIYPAEIPE